jgi:hypothetical protein
MMPLPMLLVGIVLTCCSAARASAETSTPPRSTAAEAYTQANPMIFVVARGRTDACGPGCSEWIAADGMFDNGIEKRFRDFLVSVGGRNLPIYFNSIGGIIGQSRVIGRILRERRMTASVGQTIPEGCASAVSPTPTAGRSCNRIRILKRNCEPPARCVTRPAFTL